MIRHRGSIDPAASRSSRPAKSTANTVIHREGLPSFSKHDTLKNILGAKTFEKYQARIDTTVRRNIPESSRGQKSAEALGRSRPDLDELGPEVPKAQNEQLNEALKKLSAWEIKISSQAQTISRHESEIKLQQLKISTLESQIALHNGQLDQIQEQNLLYLYNVTNQYISNVNILMDVHSVRMSMQKVVDVKKHLIPDDEGKLTKGLLRKRVDKVKEGLDEMQKWRQSAAKWMNRSTAEIFLRALGAKDPIPFSQFNTLSPAIRKVLSEKLEKIKDQQPAREPLDLDGPSWYEELGSDDVSWLQLQGVEKLPVLEPEALAEQRLLRCGITDLQLREELLSGRSSDDNPSSPPGKSHSSDDEEDEELPSSSETEIGPPKTSAAKLGTGKPRDEEPRGKNRYSIPGKYVPDKDNWRPMDRRGEAAEGKAQTVAKLTPVDLPQGIPVPKDTTYTREYKGQMRAWICPVAHCYGTYINAGDKKSCKGCGTSKQLNSQVKNVRFFLPTGTFRVVPGGYTWQDKMPSTAITKGWYQSSTRMEKRSSPLITKMRM